MASRVSAPEAVANFKPSRIERMKSKPSAASKRDGMSAKHLDLLRRLPCCVSLQVGSVDVHHLKGSAAKAERGMGMRSTDKWGVPLAHWLHMELELKGSRNELAWFQSMGIQDPYALADALWNARGDYGAMLKIVHANHGRKANA